MAFKVTSGTDRLSYDLWSGTGWTTNVPACIQDPAMPCTEDYKAQSVEEWTAVQQVLFKSSHVWPFGVTNSISPLGFSGSPNIHVYVD